MRPARRARTVAIVVFLALVALAGTAFGLRQRLARWYLHHFTPMYVAPAVPARAQGGINLVPVATGFREPTDIQFVPGRKHVAIVLEKRGRARFVDVSAGGRKVAAAGSVVFQVDVVTDSELGLLGLAFHPKYEENGRFFVNYNPASSPLRTVISEWRLAAKDVGRERAVEVRKILEVEQPYQNHNGGQLAFGPDGYLYIGLGDGGHRADPHGNGQNLATLLGSMLRIDVDGARPYAIPKDNPFIGRKGARPEIWAYGLRNPWRYSFDPHGRLVVADVGQDRFEEIDIVARGDNLGWDVREARHCFEPESNCRTAGFVEPIFEYGRDLGTSVIGGYVYTGDAVPALSDRYLFADFTSGRIWSIKLPSVHLPSTELAEARVIGQWPYLIVTFGRDQDGELYVADFAAGGLYSIASAR